jgi:hypothetical protein
MVDFCSCKWDELKYLMGLEVHIKHRFPVRGREIRRFVLSFP